MLGMKQECVELKCKATGVILGLKGSGGRNGSGVFRTERSYGVADTRDAIPSSDYQGLSTTR